MTLKKILYSSFFIFEILYFLNPETVLIEKSKSLSNSILISSYCALNSIKTWLWLFIRLILMWYLFLTFIELFVSLKVSNKYLLIGNQNVSLVYSFAIKSINIGEFIFGLSFFCISINRYLKPSLSWVTIWRNPILSAFEKYPLIGSFKLKLLSFIALVISSSVNKHP